MTEDPQYTRRLVAAMQARDIPPAQISQAVAEVQSHLADSGETARAAFGEPDEYAAQLAGAIRTPPHRLFGGRALWASRALAVASFAAGGLLLGSILRESRAGHTTTAIWWGAAAVAAFGALGWTASRLHRRSRLVDPRTGATVDAAPQALLALLAAILTAATLAVFLTLAR